MNNKSTIIIVIIAIIVYYVYYQLNPFIQRILDIRTITISNEDKAKDAIKLGVLGTAAITENAIIYPAGKLRHIVVYGIAARDINRALSYAKKFKIPNVFETYEDLINDPNIDAIYNPLPNGLHAYWTIKALNAGKAVLCEKPIASNAYEAKEMLKAAEKNNALLVEAVHSRFHPVAKHVYDLIHTSKVIGNIQHVSTNFNINDRLFPNPGDKDIRYNVNGQYPELAGGSTMDAGFYAINFMRYFANEEPILNEIQSTMVERFENVDSSANANFTFPSGFTGDIACSFRSMIPSASATIEGTNGKIYVMNYLAPFIYHRIDIYDKNNNIIKTEKHYGGENNNDGTTTYQYQLNTFANALYNNKNARALKEIEESGSMQEAILNMKVIDMVYRKAGLSIRKGFDFQHVTDDVKKGEESEEDNKEEVKRRMKWNQLITTNTLLERSSHGISVVNINGIRKLVVFGGENIARTPIDNKVHVLNLSSPFTTTTTTLTWEEQKLSSASKNIDIPKARIAHAQASVDSKIYIFGGRQSLTMEEAPLNDLYSFDVSTSIWENLSPTKSDMMVDVPTPRSFHKMLSVGNTLYVFGGCGKKGRLSDLYSYDIIAKHWVKLPDNGDMISGRGGAGFTYSTDLKSLFIIGGFSGKEMNDVFRYDIEARRYYEIYSHEDKNNPVRPFSVSCGGVLNNMIYYFGGEVDPSQNGHEGAGDFSNEVQMLDGITGKVMTTHKIAGNEKPLARGWSDATTFLDDNGNENLIIFGGLSGNDENPKRLNDIWILRKV